MIADISKFEALQNSVNCSMSSQSVFNEFSRNSDTALVKALQERIDHLKKGKPKKQEQDDYEREVNWTKGVYDAAKERLTADEYE
jgi:hypothetical protein